MGRNDKKRNALNQQAQEADDRPRRPGLPAKSSILSEKTFVSPGKRRYRILKTTERDPYDEPDPAEEKKRR